MKKRKWSAALFVCILWVLLSSASVLAADNEVAISGGTKRDNAPDISYGTNYVDSLTKTQQTNWYKLTTKGKESFCTIWMKNYGIGSKITATLCKGTSLDPLSTIKNKKTEEEDITIKLSPNSAYYICITNAVSTTTGRYGFSVSLREDNESDQPKNALKIRDGQKTAGSIDADEDVDWFKFVAPASVSYKVILRQKGFGGLYIFGCMYDDNGNRIEYEFGLGSYKYKLKGGETYYIKLRGAGSLMLPLVSFTCYTLQILNQTKLTDLTLNRTGTVKVKRGKTLVADVKSVAPAKASKAVTWRSSAPRIAAVDENGRIKGLGIGTATITATSVVTKKITASFKVSVIPETPVIIEVRSAKTKTAVLTWNKIVGAKFEIYRTESKNGMRRIHR